MQNPPNSPRRRGLLGDRRGFVAIVLGLLAIPLVGIIGLGVDYGFSVRAEALLNSAADSAALAATDTASNAVVHNQTNFSQQGVAAGTQVFNAQAVNVPNVTISPVTIRVTQNPPGSTTFVTTVSYTASYKTWFGNLFGTPTFALGGGSTAQITLKAYEDFHILMDTSGSMAIGATAADMAALAPKTLAASKAAANNQSPFNTTYNGKYSYMPQAAQGTQCAFGCHWDTSNTNCTNCDFYEIARANNIMLRQDLEQQAVQQVLNTLASQDTISQYRAAVYGFSTIYATSGNTTTIANNLQVVSSLPPTGSGSSAIIAAASAASNMVQPVSGTDLSPAPPGSLSAPEPNTNFGAAMTAMAAGMNCPGTSSGYIPCPGDGATNTAPQEFLFIITDGMEDFCQSVSGTSGCNGRTIQPIQPSECSALKAQGVQILVLYVQYYPLDVSPYYNGFYVSNVQHYVDPNGTTPPTSPPYRSGTVPANLLACSSPTTNANTSNFFYASDSSQIATQLNAMLLAAEAQGVRFVK